MATLARRNPAAASRFGSSLTSGWNPFSELEEILDHYSQQMMPDIGDTTKARGLLKEADWIPVVDINENRDAFVLTAEIPGVSKENVNVSIDRGVLTIKGERRMEKEASEEEGRQHRIERAYGQFARSFTLPDNVDEENIKARHHDGLLELTLPKREEAKPRSIEVDVQ